MKNINILPLSTLSKKKISEGLMLLNKGSNVFIEIISFDDNRVIVRAEQKALNEVKQLSKKELEKRVKDLFLNEIPAEWKLTISAVDFDRKDIENINANWVLNNMVKFHLKVKHISTYTGIDKPTINKLLKENSEFSEWQKVAFYYFFKYKEISKFTDYQAKDIVE